MEDDPRNLAGMPWEGVALRADAESAAEALASGAAKKRTSQWFSRCMEAGEKASEAAASAAGKAGRTAAGLLGPNDIVVTDGPAARGLAASLAKEAEFAQLHVMDDARYGGTGLPFALGAAVGNPEKRVVLVCGREALFHHVREIQPGSCANLNLDVLCLDEGSLPNNQADPAAVLQGLGAAVLPAKELAGPKARSGVRAAVLAA
ncbi:MAG: hypothetical protein JRI97_06500 [Deltaproteobacteria bacterium]|nr:hypothetical protein [Deltaproteobacteria bacterium]